MNLQRAYYLTFKDFQYNHCWLNLKIPASIYQMELTNACPMSCVMCPRRNMTRPTGFMDERCFKNIVSQIKTITPFVRLHHFGESLMHPMLYEYLCHLRTKRIGAGLSVNPTELTQDKIEAICQGGLSELIISLDGVTDGSYKEKRGAHADLMIAKKNVENLLAYKKKFNFAWPKITMQMIRMNNNGYEVEFFKKQWAISGVHAVCVKDYHIWSGSDEMIKKMAPAQKNTPKFPCFFPWDSMVVLWDGRIVPCCNDYNGGYILGDVGKKSLEEIWNDQPMIELRKQQLLNRFENNNLCSGCYEPCGYRPNRLYPVSSDAWFVKRFLVRLMSMG